MNHRHLFNDIAARFPATGLMAGVALSASLFAPSAWAQTADATVADKWQFEASAYLWGAGIGGETTSGGEIDISFSDLLENLDMALMANLSARRGNWAVASDIIYLNVSDDNENDLSLPGPAGLPVTGKTKVSLKAWVISPRVNYTLLSSEQGNLDAVVGARFLSIDVGLKVKASSAIGGRSVNGSADGSVWDGIVGLNGNIKLTDKWFLRYYGDVGTGQSDFTWQALGMVGYRFNKVDALLGYRYMKWQFDGVGGLDNLDLKGPMAGFTYRF